MKFFLKENAKFTIEGNFTITFCLIVLKKLKRNKIQNKIHTFSLCLTIENELVMFFFFIWKL
jgi:hypothetical protein